MRLRLPENTLYKLLALGFACALHFYASNLLNPPQSRTLSVPLAPRNLSPDLLWPKPPPQVTVTLTGPADQLNRVADSAVAASVDLSHAVPGRPLSLSVRVGPLAGEPGVSVEAEPQSVSLTLALKSAKWLPLSANAPSAPPVGYTFRTPTISPRRAKIVGSREAVDAVQQLVVSMDGGPTAGAIDDDYPVIALDGQNNQRPDVVVSPAMVHVHIGMARVPATKTLVVSPVVTGSPPFPFQITRIDVSPQTIVVSGRPDLLGQTSTLPTAPFDVSGATTDVTRQAPLAPPSGLTPVGAPAVTVTVHIAASPPSPAPSSPAPALGGPTPTPAAP